MQPQRPTISGSDHTDRTLLGQYRFGLRVQDPAKVDLVTGLKGACEPIRVVGKQKTGKQKTAEQEQKARSAVAAELLLEGTLRRLSSKLSVGGKERAEPLIPA